MNLRIYTSAVLRIVILAKFGPKALYLFHQSRYRTLHPNLANITIRCTDFHWRSWSSATAGLRSSCTVDGHEQADGDNVHPVLGEEGPNRNFHITKSNFFLFCRFLKSQSRSTDPNECGSDRIRTQITALFWKNYSYPDPEGKKTKVRIGFRAKIHSGQRTKGTKQT